MLPRDTYQAGKKSQGTWYVTPAGLLCIAAAPSQNSAMLSGVDFTFSLCYCVCFCQEHLPTHERFSGNYALREGPYGVDFSMKKDLVKQERRAAPRFHAGEEGEIVVFPQGVISYKLIDISETGLAFCYAATDDHGWIDSSCSIDLVEKKFSLEGIPAKIVSDRHHTPLRITENGIVPSLRRVGVQFIHLSGEQKKTLKRYLMPEKKFSALPAMTTEAFAHK